jgi:hypothetical protein
MITVIEGRFKVTIVPGVSITVSEPHTGRTKTYKMGDMAEYDSYNLSYYGPIVGISDKRVRIVCRFDYPNYVKDTSSAKVHSLSLEKFCWRAIGFDLGDACANNAVTSHYI